MDEILIVARQFPPYEGQGGVVRVLKFCKYFPCFGFKPLVVTVNKDPCRIIDPRRNALLQEIAEQTEIFYVPENRLIRWIETRTRKKKKLKRVQRRSLKFRLRFMGSVILKGIVTNLYRPVKKRFVAPDEGILWNRKAKKVCTELIRKRNIRYLLTTSPLNSSHMLGRTLKQQFHLTWCADFRDAWPGNPLFQTKYVYRNDWEERQAGKVLQAADLVTSVNEPIVESLKSHAGTEGNTRFELISNGFDPEELDCEPHAFDDRFINIIHCGYISQDRNMKSLLEAMIAGVQAGKPFRLHLVGHVNDTHCRHYQKMYPDVVHLTGVASRTKTMQLLKGADIALLIFPDNNFAALSGKIFEYLSCDKRVIGLVPGGIARDFIEKFDMGWCCDMNDVTRIAGILDEVHGLWKEKRLRIHYPDGIKGQFNRKILSGRVADLLREEAKISNPVSRGS